MYRLTNIHKSAVGLPGNKMLPVGETVQLELSEEDYKIMEACPYVKISNLGGPTRRGNKKKDATAKTKDASERDDETSTSFV